MAEYEYRRDNPTICRSPGHYVPCDIQGHLEFMHETVLGFEKPVIIELGIQAGNSTSALLSAAERRGGIMYSCDIQTRAQLQERLEHDRVEWWDHPSWRVFCGDDLSDEALAWMPEQCDILFVDSDHSYEHVRDVLAAYMPRLRPSGTALFHDTQYQSPGDVDLGEPNGVVAQAINEYCARNGLSWTNRPGSYGLGIVRP
jgi:hypothetical protein